MAIPTPKIKKSPKQVVPHDPLDVYLATFPGISRVIVSEVLSREFLPSKVGEIYAEIVYPEETNEWMTYVSQITEKLALQEEEITFFRRAKLVPKEWPMKKSKELIQSPFFDITDDQLGRWWAASELSNTIRGYICLLSLMIAEEDIPFAFQTKDHLFASLLRKILHRGPAEERVISYFTNESLADEGNIQEMNELAIDHYARWSLPKFVGYDVNNHSGLLDSSVPYLTKANLLDGVEEGLMFWISQVVKEYNSLRATLVDTNYVRNLPRSILEEYGMNRLPTSRIMSVTSLIQAFYGLQGYTEGMKFISEMNGDEPYVLHPVYQKVCVAVRKLVEEYKRMHFFDEVGGMTLLQKAAIVHNAKVETLERVTTQTHLRSELIDIEAYFEYTTSCVEVREGDGSEDVSFDVNDDDDWNDIAGAPPVFDWEW